MDPDTPVRAESRPAADGAADLAEPLPPLASTPGLLRLVVPALALTAALVALGAYLVQQEEGGAAPTIPSAGGELVGFVLDPPRDAPAFTLTSHTGAPATLSDARGNAVLLFFGFTSCPDVCPTTLLTIARALDALGSDASRVTPIFVSIDPERDSLTVLADYVSGYDARIVGATADLDTLSDIAEEYGIRFQKVFAEGVPTTSGNYTMDHSATMFLIDPEGRLRAAYLEPTPDDLAHDLLVVLAR